MNILCTLNPIPNEDRRAYWAMQRAAFPNSTGAPRLIPIMAPVHKHRINLAVSGSAASPCLSPIPQCRQGTFSRGGGAENRRSVPAKIEPAGVMQNASAHEGQETPIPEPLRAQSRDYCDRPASTFSATSKERGPGDRLAEAVAWIAVAIEYVWLIDWWRNG